MLQKLIIGFLLTPGYSPADIIGLDAVLAIHPRNQVFYVAETDSIVYGNYRFGIQPNATFQDCPPLDILVIGGMAPEEMNNPKVVEFMTRKSQEAKHVIAVSNGVLALYKAGVLTQQMVTADRHTLQLLESSTLTLKNEGTCMVDGKFITGGPSTGGIEAAFTAVDKTRGKWITQMLEFNLEYDAHVQYPVAKDTVLKAPHCLSRLKLECFWVMEFTSPT
ncbi:DJ-1/PfpI family protein [bacterium SCSIO 12741]|nr:DJ-1/PfpI family protein [bacterium SCSIO 12741]